LIQEAKTRQAALEEKEKLVAELNGKVEGLNKELEESRAKIAELEKKVATPAPVTATNTGGEVSGDNAELVSLLGSDRIHTDDRPRYALRRRVCKRSSIKPRRSWRPLKPHLRPPLPPPPPLQRPSPPLQLHWQIASVRR